MNANNRYGPHNFNMPTWISPAPFEQMLSMKIIYAENGEAVLQMPFLKSFAQGGGLMHGGAMVSLADTAVVMAIKSVLSPGTHFATISLGSRFIHPVKKGIIEAKAKIVEHYGTTIKGSCDIFDEAKRKVMIFDSVFKIAKDAEIKNVIFNYNQ